MNPLVFINLQQAKVGKAGDRSNDIGSIVHHYSRHYSENVASRFVGAYRDSEVTGGGRKHDRTCRRTSQGRIGHVKCQRRRIRSASANFFKKYSHMPVYGRVKKCADALHKELDIEPSQLTRELFQLIKAEKNIPSFLF